MEQRPLPPNLTKCSQAFSHLIFRRFPKHPKFNSLLLFSFLQKWNRNFKHLKFHTGNSFETTDRSRAKQHWGGVCRGCAKRRSGKAGDQAHREHNFAEQVGELQIFTHRQRKAKLCGHCGVYLPSCSWCQVLACTAGHWHVLFNPRTALAPSPVPALSSELPWLARATHHAPGGHFRRNTTMSYRPLNRHDLVKNHRFLLTSICFKGLSWK